MAEYQTLLLDRPEAGIAVLTLNRPECLNAISWKMVEELHACLSAFEADAGLRVVILTGAGRGFCSGTDLKAGRGVDDAERAPDASAISRRQRYISDLSLHLRKIPQPIIAAVNGVAAGGGFSFSMACDMRIAAESASFICSFINIGLSSGDVGSSYWLPRLIGLSRAADLLYSGRPMDAREAERFGYVSKVVPDGEALNAALDAARVMLEKSPFGLRMTKEVLNHSIDAPSLEAALYMENRTQTLAVQTDAFREAVQAFREKRPPEFTKQET